MDVRDRVEQDPALKALVDLLTAWLMEHSHYTPTELREAAMYAATRVEMMTMRHTFYFDRFGNVIDRPLTPPQQENNGIQR